ncbi:MAG TPA: A/G-specific adenine glycosylase [Puia sp.]|nr:A/G-specific adenine glycosylase [Puia sp.]
MKMEAKKTRFTNDLLQWHRTQNFRQMPWKGEKDPYRVWLSEVILQQTRVDQGRAYYEKFVTVFPTIHDLAVAPEQQVFKLWEGLGYYTRCRNLIATAKTIDRDFNGRFPSTYREILALKGIGPYTAAAIASFAFDLPHAVVDGNVLRVLARFFGITAPIDTRAGRSSLEELAMELLDVRQASAYNQAIMDFGATVCTPRSPHCDACIHQSACTAWKESLVGRLPVKEKIPQRKRRFLYYFFVEMPGGKVYIRQRSGKDIWKGLHEFVLIETADQMGSDDLLRSDEVRQLFDGQPLTARHISKVYSQALTHQTVQGQFIAMRFDKPPTALRNYFLIPKAGLASYAFPKFINKWLLAAEQQKFIFS